MKNPVSKENVHKRLGEPEYDLYTIIFVYKPDGSIEFSESMRGRGIPRPLYL